MLVSTLIFILIGFMLIVLFSMIPVVWRIQTDASGMGERTETPYRQYARDRSDPARAEQQDFADSSANSLHPQNNPTL